MSCSFPFLSRTMWVMFCSPSYSTIHNESLAESNKTTHFTSLMPIKAASQRLLCRTGWDERCSIKKRGGLVCAKTAQAAHSKIKPVVKPKASRHMSRRKETVDLVNWRISASPWWNEWRTPEVPSAANTQRSRGRGSGVACWKPPGTQSRSIRALITANHGSHSWSTAARRPPFARQNRFQSNTPVRVKPCPTQCPCFPCSDGRS